MEQDGRDVPAAGVARSSNTVFVMAHDWASTAQFLAPSLQRVDDAQRDVQLLIVTPDAEVAAATAATAVKLTEGRDIGIVAATSVRRAARIIKTQPAQVIAGSADTLVELLKAAALKLDTVRLVCIAWADELVALGALPSLESLMTEVPKESARTVVTSELTPEVEALLESYARRARRVVSPTSETDEPLDLEYVSVAPQTRLSTLRRVLDELDPASAVIFVRDGESTVDVRGLLDSLGYRGGDAAIRTGMAAAPGTELVVLFDLPASREELRAAAGSASRRIALVQPRQLASLRLLTAGGSTKPLTLGEAAGRARSRDESLRAELRNVLAEGHFGRELIALGGLLDEFDGAEIAAAAVQLLERERVARAKQATAPATEARERVESGMTRLFMTIGSRDNARPGDIVGAIANTAGITSAQIGKIDLRESHSTIEVANDVADTVVERVTGTSIKGRRVVIRREKRDAAGGKWDAGGGRREPREGGRESRGERSGPRGERRESRGERREPPRGERREPRGERRPARGPRFGDRE